MLTIWDTDNLFASKTIINISIILFVIIVSYIIMNKLGIKKLYPFLLILVNVVFILYIFDAIPSIYFAVAVILMALIVVSIRKNRRENC